MDPKYYGLVEVLFTTTVVFGLGFWQLWSLRRDAKGLSGPNDRPKTP